MMSTKIDLSNFSTGSGRNCECKVGQNDQDCLFRSLSIVYDLFAITIGTLDLITDILVLISYYTNGHGTLFIISLTVLIIAQISYCIGFAIKNTGGFSECSRNIFEITVVSLCCLPFAPFMSFIFYLTDDKNNWLSKFLTQNFSYIEIDSNNFASQDEAPFRQMMEKKILKHMGFILEACLEALPQSILQMYAIVYFNETNILTIGSVFLSLISVSSKSLIGCVFLANDFLSIFFYWMCVITDFFGIFFIVSWIFYDFKSSINYNINSGTYQNAVDTFDTIVSLWYIKVSCFVCPVWVFIGLLYLVCTVACTICLFVEIVLLAQYNMHNTQKLNMHTILDTKTER